MLADLCTLTHFDVVTLTLTFLTVFLVQLINAHLGTTTTTKTTTSTSNGKLQKQQSEISEDNGSASPTASPTASARNSINSQHNGNISHPLPPDNISDDFHDDEDTLSLENLFPCDQSEIYASKKISFIIDELIQTEANYVNNLRKGIQNYGKLQERQDLPAALQGEQQQRQLLSNIDEILMLHERQIWPMMLRNQRDLKTLFDEFAVYFEKNSFYCYVIFMINKKTSMQLRQEQREWFQKYQDEIKDKLGIDSFLVQPIQRLTRYPLLLQQFISEFYKSGISCRPVLMSVCKLETRMRRLLDVVNQSEEIAAIEELGELNLLEQGNFHRSNEFDAYHHRSRKKYRAKVFLFDRCLLCAEVRKRRLAYRQHYGWDALELQPNTSKSVTLHLLQVQPIGGVTHKEEYELSVPEAISMKQWLRATRKIIAAAQVDATQMGKFSLPMDLMLGVALAIWLIWRYL